MRQVPQSRQLPLANKLKAGGPKHVYPIQFTSEGASAGAFSPFQIVRPADEAVPGRRWNVFVDNCHATRPQHTLHFHQHRVDVLRVMQHVCGHDGVKGRVRDREFTAVVWPIINRRFRRVGDVDSRHGFAQQRRQMMRDVAVAATDVQHYRSTWNHPRDLQSHIVCAADLSSPPFAQPTALCAITGSC